MPEYSNDDKKVEAVPYSQPHVFRDLARSQKIAMAVLAFFACIVFIFAINNMREGIYSPFAKKTSTSTNKDAATSQEGLCPNGDCSDLTDEDLKAKDTDKDGLSDYDELNFYKTSPYLDDSDSDGFSDKEEINNSKDPNCPSGRDCDSDVLLNAAADVVNPGTANNIDLEELNAQAKATADQTATGTESGEFDAATLRQMLLKAGMDKATLDNMSDEFLLTEFAAVAAEEQGAAQ